MGLGFHLGYGYRRGPANMNETPADVPGILQSKVAKLGHTHLLNRLLRDHGLFQVLTHGIPHWVRCGRIFVKETRAGWRGAECCTVSFGCIVRTSLPSAGAFLQMLFLPCDYMCEQQEFMSSPRSDKRLKLFISRKWQERESSERSSQRLWGVKYRWVNSPHVITSQQQNLSAL